MINTTGATYSTDEMYQGPESVDIKESGFGPWRKVTKRLVRDYCFEWGRGNKAKRIVRKAGLEWDGASTSGAQAIGFIRDGYNMGPSMFHDEFYARKGHLKEGEFEFHTWTEGGWRLDTSPWSRAQADELFEMMCKCAGMNGFKAAVQKWAVKLYPPNWFKGF